jgi:uncharacterized integral membrane protein
MLRRIISTLIVLPLAVIIIAFAVTNRQLVTVSFDPFSSANPAYAATLPLFILIFVLVIFGVFIGGAAVWIRQSKWRRTARRLDGEVHTLNQELDAIRHRFAPGSAQAPGEPNPYTVIPPPIP